VRHEPTQWVLHMSRQACRSIKQACLRINQSTQQASMGASDTRLSLESHHPRSDGPDGYRGTTALAHAASGGSVDCVKLLLAARADVRLPKPPRANALHYAAFKLQRHCATVLCNAPHASEALAAFGNSALWASLGAQTPGELARFNAAQALEFANALEAREEQARGSQPRALSLTRAKGLPPAISPLLAHLR